MAIDILINVDELLNSYVNESTRQKEYIPCYLIYMQFYKMQTNVE